jgi:hypothetical protein
MAQKTFWAVEAVSGLQRKGGFGAHSGSSYTKRDPFVGFTPAVRVAQIPVTA